HIWDAPILLDPARFPCQTLSPMSDLAIATESPSRSPLSAEVARRRTFAIISHPDAGKTTLTEKLLLYGGAIQEGGSVRAPQQQAHPPSVTTLTLAPHGSARMVRDGAKGIEPQTRKLFEVCRMRHIPILCFVNKLDQPAKDPFELLSTLARELKVTAVP